MFSKVNSEYMAILRIMYFNFSLIFNQKSLFLLKNLNMTQLGMLALSLWNLTLCIK